jgi:thioesterase domain-containing protein
LPLTVNGKLDRQALARRKPEVDRAGDGAEALPPRDTLELALIQIWEELLEQRPIGVKDDFFARGGHSLMAVRLFSQIDRRLGHRLPLHVLFQGATVEHLAATLRRQGWHEAASPLVEIQPRGDRTPVYFVHPVGGNVLCYAQLAARLGDDQPFFAFRAPGLDEGEEPLATVGALAETYLAHLRARQPQGPYLLGGWSMGGVVAWEMARRLEESGEEVPLVALLDSHADSGPDVDEPSLLAAFARDLGLRWDGLEDEEVRRLAAVTAEERLSSQLARAQEEALLPPDVDLVRLERLYRAFASHSRALAAHAPRAATARLLLVRAEESARKAASDDLGWGPLAIGGLEAHTVPGDHFAVVREPNTRRVAELLRQAADRAERASSEGRSR